MTSFAVRIEPAAQPRLAAAALIVHGAAAVSPWLTGCLPVVAAGLSLAACAGLAATLRSVPGPHGRLRRLDIDGRGCRVWVAPHHNDRPAQLGSRCRVFPGLVGVELRVDDCRLAWLLPRTAVPPAEFRRLKARIRLAC